MGPKVTEIEEAKQTSTMQMDELIGNLQTYELKKIDKVAEEPKKELNLVLKASQHDSESDDEEMMMFFKGSRNSSRRKILKKESPKIKEEQRRNSKKRQQIASRAFKKAMKATWGETSNEESEGKEVENDNLDLMVRSNSDSSGESSEVNLSDLKTQVHNLSKRKMIKLLFSLMDECILTLTTFNRGSISFRGGKKGTVDCIRKIALQKSEDEYEIGLNQHSTEKVHAPAVTVKETDFMNVPSGSGHELENPGGTNHKTMEPKWMMAIQEELNQFERNKWGFFSGSKEAFVGSSRAFDILGHCSQVLRQFYQVVIEKKQNHSLLYGFFLIEVFEKFGFHKLLRTEVKDLHAQIERNEEVVAARHIVLIALITGLS
ncbi:hypothetical protein HAX54_034797 [Datura stramonium]|uniref:Uncharacterized protein n=1 Tax=Datura stramonium TaxID=4076 RepID=A0ABS8SEI2_DATST|nr:hypothetical protein [Datura stramonium]